MTNAPRHNFKNPDNRSLKGDYAYINNTGIDMLRELIDQQTVFIDKSSKLRYKAALLLIKLGLCHDLLTDDSTMRLKLGRHGK